MTWFNPQVFRKNDIRGRSEQDLTPKLIGAVGQAYGTRVAHNGGKSVVVGRDCRLSGERIQHDFVSGVRAAGIDVIDLGVVPTPLVYYALHTNTVDGGVVITGSHNPSDWNGLKLCLGKSSMYGEQIQTLRQSVEGQIFSLGSGSLSALNVEADYITDMLQRLRPMRRKIKVVIDGGNGTAGLIAAQLLRQMGCDVIELYCQPDGHFPNHHPDPTIPENLVDLRQEVIESKADLGIAFDGDGDRIGAMDETGEIIWGDQLLTLFGLQVAQEHPQARIIGEVKCSRVMYDTLRNAGAQVDMWKVGHSFIKARMKETGALLAGEMSGHLFFGDRGYGYDDAIYAAARLCELIGRDSSSLADRIGELPKMYATPELRVECADEKKFVISAQAADDFSHKYDVCRIDGVRIEFEHGWGLLRASNTQPALVLRFEAETPSLRDAYREEVETWIQDHFLADVRENGEAHT